MEYIGIYNASSTISGELLYVIGKLFKKTECSLCDISHGLSFKAKDEWDEELAKFPYNFKALHTNEIPKSLKDRLKEFPVVIALENDNYTIIMDKNELKACEKNPKIFFETLKGKIENCSTSCCDK